MLVILVSAKNAHQIMWFLSKEPVYTRDRWL